MGRRDPDAGPLTVVVKLGHQGALAVLKDGRRERVVVEHAIGSLQRPMSDAALADKFAAQADPVLGAARTADLIAGCRRLGTMADVRELVALARPTA